MTLTLKRGKGKEPEDTCVICLCPKDNPVKLPCTHSFCKRCWDRYREAREWPAKKCPICRRRLKKSWMRTKWNLWRLAIIIIILMSVAMMCCSC